MGGLGLDDLRADVERLKAWAEWIEGASGDRVEELQDLVRAHDKFLEKMFFPGGDGGAGGGEVMKRLRSLEVRVGQLGKDVSVLLALRGRKGKEDGEEVSLSGHIGGDGDGLGGNGGGEGGVSSV